MTDTLSREQIEHYRTTGQYPAGMMGATFRTLICDMALRSLDAALLAQPAAADFTCDKTIYGHPRCAIQCPECAEPAAAGVSEWKVFCAICKKEWSVPYHHPGKSICNECERHSLAERADRVSEERSAQQQLNAIVDYIMGYWPISFAYVNPMQAIQVMVWRMVKAERALAERAGWVSEEDKL